ncbi:MAG: hypothetical protein ACFE0Q_04645 [Anaerolineae bacterium]
MDALQYFHYGQLVHHGTPKGEMRVLARSAGITDAFIALVLETARLTPLPNSSGVAWGMLRTQRKQPLTIARVEQDPISDALIYQFIQAPSDAVRELAGNLSALRPYVIDPLPVYEMLGDTLTPIDLPDVRISTEQQVDSLLNLMSHAHNNIRNIEPLIGAIVSGTPLVIVNAPLDGNLRLEFIEGLLMLLPASTRLGVTFLAHHTPNNDLKAQIMFMTQASDDDQQVIYDWETGKVSGKEIKNEYSRFVTSQMRLDPELVTRETEKLTSTAGWRFTNGDSLSKALDYASHRAKVDQSLANGMPVEVASVATILADDPTLTDEQRVMYARHLINFSLALDDLQYVDAVIATMNQHPDIEQEVYKYMSNALNSGQGAVIFETLVRWHDNPFSPTGNDWQQLLQRASLAELDELIEDQDAEMISAYLDDMRLLGKRATPIIGRVIDRALPLAKQDATIPTKILLLAIDHLDDASLQTLMNTPAFVQFLPADMRRLLTLFSQRDRPAPAGTLYRAVQSLPDDQRISALVALVKQAYTNQRIELIDERSLLALVKALNVNPTLIDGRMLTGIVEAMQTHTIANMKRPAPRLLLQLALLSQNYMALGTLMIAQSRDIYGAEDQHDYIQSIQETFAKTQLTASDALQAVKALEALELNDIQIIAVILGALEGTRWSADLKPLADRVMRDVGDNHRLLEMLPAQVIYSLLKYISRRGNPQRLRIAARIMGSCAATDHNKTGLSVINHAYKMLAARDKTRPYAIEVVRQYVREAQEKPARHMISFYSDQLGADVRKQLQLSYEFSNLMARMDWLTYASSLQITVDLLQALVNNYDDPNAQPNLGDARLQIEHLRRSSSLGQLRELSDDLRKLAHAIVVLNQRHQQHSATSDKHKKAIATCSADPRSVLDIYRASGGYLLGKNTHPFMTQAGDARALFGFTDIEELRVNITIASTVLHEATNALSNVRDMWTIQALIGEIDSQTATLVGASAKGLHQMGRNWQRLADLVLYIIDKGDTSVIEANNSHGRKLEKLETAPTNALDLLRFVYGYFAK